MSSDDWDDDYNDYADELFFHDESALDIFLDSDHWELSIGSGTFDPERNPFALFSKDLLLTYKPDKLLGHDDFAVVYRAIRLKDSMPCAIKVPREMKPASDLLRKEIHIWCHLNHENVLNIESLPISTTIAIEMPYIDGLTLGEEQVISLADLPKPIQEAFAVTIIRGVARGIKYVHRQGVRHYHLKPSSILLTPTMIPKVSGFARGQNEFGACHGEDWVSAPELRDEEAYGTPGMKTDVFLLGSLFYELLTGYPPFSSALYTLFPDIPKDTLVPASRIKPELERFDQLLNKTLSISKEDRYDGVREFIVALNRLYGWKEPPRRPVNIDDNIRARVSQLAEMGNPQHIVLPPLHEDLMEEYGDLTELENDVSDDLLE